MLIHTDATYAHQVTITTRRALITDRCVHPKSNANRTMSSSRKRERARGTRHASNRRDERIRPERWQQQQQRELEVSAPSLYTTYNPRRRKRLGIGVCVELSRELPRSVPGWRPNKGNASVGQTLRE